LHFAYNQLTLTQRITVGRSARERGNGHSTKIETYNYFRSSVIVVVNFVICQEYSIYDVFPTGTILPYPDMARTLTIEIIIIFLLAFIEGVRIFLGM